MSAHLVISREDSTEYAESATSRKEEGSWQLHTKKLRKGFRMPGAYEMWKPGELDENSDKKHLGSGTLIYIEDANGDVEEEFVDGFGWI